MSTSAKSPENARKNERVKVDAFVKVNGGNDREYVFRTRDLSAGGLFLYTKVTHIYPIKVGSKLTLELYDFDEYITCTVVVMRVVEPDSAESEDYPTGFGVKIIDLGIAKSSTTEETRSSTPGRTEGRARARIRQAARRAHVRAGTGWYTSNASLKTLTAAKGVTYHREAIILCEFNRSRSALIGTGS